MIDSKESEKKNNEQREGKNCWWYCVAASFGIMFLVLLFMVAILEKPLVKREQERKKNMEEVFLKKYDSFAKEDISVEIQFRDVDVSKRYDRMYAKISVENDIVEMTCIFKVEYTLENKKWILQEFCLSDCNYTILASDITQEDSNAQIEDYFAGQKVQNLRYTWKEHSLNLERGREAYTYAVEWREGRKMKKEQVVVWYCFDWKEGWEFSEIQCY